MREALLRLTRSPRFLTTVLALTIVDLVADVLRGPGEMVASILGLWLVGYYISSAREVARNADGGLPPLGDVGAHLRRGLTVALAAGLPVYVLLFTAITLLGGLLQPGARPLLWFAGALVSLAPWIIGGRYVLHDRFGEAFRYIDSVKRVWAHRSAFTPVLLVTLFWVGTSTAAGWLLSRLVGPRASLLDALGSLASGHFSMPPFAILGFAVLTALITQTGWLLASRLFGAYVTTAYTTAPGDGAVGLTSGSS